MKPLLVCGDSFALLDDKHSHWMNIASTGNSCHVAYPGANHTHICADLNQEQLSKYSGVVYHITELFRSEYTDNNISYQDIADNVEQIYETDFVKMYTSTSTEFGTAKGYFCSPAWIEYEDTDNMEYAYRYGSLPFIVKANVNSMLSLYYNAVSNNVPFLFVISPYSEQPTGFRDVLPSDAKVYEFDVENKIWDLPDNQANIIAEKNELSSNHVCKDLAQLMADDFVEWNKEHKVFEEIM